MGMRLRSVFYGPNVLADHACAVVTIDGLEEDAGAAGCGDRCRLRFGQVLSFLQGLSGEGCTNFEDLLAIGSTSSVVAMMKSILAHYVELAGDNSAGIETLPPGILDANTVVHLLWRYGDSLLADAAATEACVLGDFILNGTLPESAGSDRGDLAAIVRSGVERIRAARKRRTRSPTARAILVAAGERSIPVMRLGEWPAQDTGGYNLDAAVNAFGLGQGRDHRLIHESCVLRSGIVPSDSRDRDAQYRLLHAAGIPLPRRDLELSNVNSSGRAVRSARRIGLPVVVKSREMLPYGGVLLDLRTPAEVEAAYSILRVRTREVVVEQYCGNPVYRLLVVRGQVIAAAPRQPFAVLGDGILQLGRLIDSQVERVSLSASQDAVSKSVRLHLDEALRLRGLHRDQVPLAGQRLVLQSGADAALRDSHKDALPLIRAHTHLVETACRVSETLGLEVCAVEISVRGSADALEPETAVVVAVDPIPDLDFHRSPGERLPTTIARQYLDHLGLHIHSGRIPIAAVTGTNGKTTTCLMLDHIVRSSGKSTGLACTDGFYVNGKRRRKGIFSGISGALQAFKEDVDVAILETSRGTLLRKGLAFDHCSVAACTNIAEDHLGEDAIQTLEQLAYVKETVIRTARDCVVLNGMDPLCLGMAARARAKRRILVFPPIHPPTKMQDLGEATETLRCESWRGTSRIVWRSQDRAVPVIDVDRIPATWAGAAVHNVENAMFAIGLALGLDIPVEGIRGALESFDSSIECAPGRLNVFDGLPFRVIVDYAHNAHGFSVLCDFVRALDSPGRRTLIVFAQERQGAAARAATAAAVAPAFDRFICRDPFKLTHVEEGHVAGQMRSALLDAGVAEDAISVIPRIDEALEQALLSAQPGDLVAVGASGRYAAVWRQLQAFSEGRLLADTRHSPDAPALEGAPTVVEDR